MHEIRYCKLKEIEKLQAYIRDEWRSDHIFTYDHDLLLWQHGNHINDRINFVVAHNTSSDEFDAIIGFIQPAHYDLSLTSENVLWLAIWHVKEKYKSKNIGLAVYRKLVREIQPANIASIGASSIAEKIYRAMRFKVGELEHYYIKNEAVDSYLLCNLKNHPELNIPTDVEVVRVAKPNDITDIQDVKEPKKSKTYIVNRYVRHPRYKYQLFQIVKNGKSISVFVTRVVKAKGAQCLRIVDWLGPFPTESIYREVQSILKKCNYEYLDLLSRIPNEKDILNMGFTKKDFDTELIPNYFEPFVNENIRVRYAFKKPDNEYYIFKGDSDQDRPNVK